MELTLNNIVDTRIITLRGQDVLIDRDVAALYNITTKEVNQAVKNNPDKFPRGYLIETVQDEKRELVKNFDRFETLKHSTSLPIAFTEKGLYMLATILKSPQATQTTIAIVEAYAGLKELSRNIGELIENPERKDKQALMERSGSILGSIFEDGLKTTDTETSVELNLAMLKIKHTVKRKTE